MTKPYHMPADYDLESSLEQFTDYLKEALTSDFGDVLGEFSDENYSDVADDDEMDKKEDSYDYNLSPVENFLCASLEDPFRQEMKDWRQGLESAIKEAVEQAKPKLKALILKYVEAKTTD